MTRSIQTRQITTLALAGLALVSPLATTPAQAGFFSKIADKIKDKAKEKWQEYTRPEFLAGKLAEKLGKKGGSAPAPMPMPAPAPAPAPMPRFATPTFAPAPMAAPAPVAARDPFGAGRQALAPRPSQDCRPRHASSIPGIRSSRPEDCQDRSPAQPAVITRPGYRVPPAVITRPGYPGNPVVASSPDAATSQRELAMRLIRLAEQLLGRTYAVSAMRSAEAAHEAYSAGMTRDRSLASFRKSTRLGGAALKGRSIRRMNRLGGESRLRVELAGDAEGARAKGPSAEGAAQKAYAQLELAAREAALQAAVATFRKARKVGMAAARKKIAEYKDKLEAEALKQMQREFEELVESGTNKMLARQIASRGLKAAREYNAEEVAEFKAKVEAEALEDARAEAWEAAERAYAKEEASAYQVAVDIDELMSASEGEPSKGAEQQARVAGRQASRKLQASAKETSGIFGLGFQGSPAE